MKAETSSSGVIMRHMGSHDAAYHAPLLSADPNHPDIASVYKPVQTQMLELEQKLDEVIEEAPAELSDKLANALKGGGKRIRPALVLLAGSLYPGRVEPLIHMAMGYELLHTATLVHDDTIDNALTRRGRPTVNRLWGNPRAVLLGDYLCGCSALMTAETGNLRAMEIFSQALANICSGAIVEHVARSRRTRDEYFITIGRKTASLFSGATESGAVLSKAPKRVVSALKSFGYNLGMTFQTIDDIQDYDSDLSCGSITLPAILLLEQPDNGWVADALDKDPPTGLDLLAEMMEDSCVLDDCLRIAQGFYSQAISSLEILPESPIRESLRTLAEYVIGQKS